MNTTRTLLIGMLLLILPNQANLAGLALAQGKGAELFQSSYDSEAVGKVQDALAAMDRMPAARQETFVVQLRRGWLLYRLLRHDDSIEAYKRAIALCPRAVEARVGILLPQMALRRWADAETQAKAALKLDGNNYLAALRLAFSLYNLHRYEDAARLYARLHELYPSDVDVAAGLGWAQLKDGKTAEAAQTFREVLEIAPKNALSLDGLKAAGG